MKKETELKELVETIMELAVDGEYEDPMSQAGDRFTHIINYCELALDVIRKMQQGKHNKTVDFGHFD